MTNAEYYQLIEEIAELTIAMVVQTEGLIANIDQELWKQLCQKVVAVSKYIE